MNWLREAISDEEKQADMAYIVIGALAVSAIAALGYILAMSTVSYVRCTHVVDVGEGVRAAIPCVFDPLPVGQAAGLIFGAFGALIGALAGYMAATRRQARTVTTTTQAAPTITTRTETPTPDAPLEVNVVGTPDQPLGKKPAKRGK